MHIQNFVAKINKFASFLPQTTLLHFTPCPLKGT
jgi:hypothetical protein